MDKTFVLSKEKQKEIKNAIQDGLETRKEGLERESNGLYTFKKAEGSNMLVSYSDELTSLNVLKKADLMDKKSKWNASAPLDATEVFDEYATLTVLGTNTATTKEFILVDSRTLEGFVKDVKFLLKAINGYEKGRSKTFVPSTEEYDSMPHFS